MLFNRLFSLVKQGYLDVDSFRTYHVHSLIMGFVFNILRPFDMALAVTESLVMNIAGQALNFLGLIGIIVYSTTAGLGDRSAMGYQEPREDS